VFWLSINLTHVCPGAAPTTCLLGQIRYLARTLPRPRRGPGARAGVGDLEREPSGEGRATTYALLVADTVVVSEGGGPPEVATALANKGWTDAAYYFKARAGEPRAGRGRCVTWRCATSAAARLRTGAGGTGV